MPKLDDRNGGFRDDDTEIKLPKDPDVINEDDLSDEELEKRHKEKQEAEEKEAKEKEEAERKAKEEEERKKAGKPEDQPDYWKNKFSESARENQLERERREKAERELEDMRKPKELTDEVMKAKYPDWDNYDDAVKTTLKNQVKMEQEMAELRQSQSTYLNERKWNDTVESFLDENSVTEKYPLKGREQEFRKYVNKSDRKGMNLDVLAAAFGFEVKPPAKTQEELDAEAELAKKKKGSLLEPGSGAGSLKKAGDGKKKYTADDAANLRKNNPREYERLIRTGELNLEV